MSTKTTEFPNYQIERFLSSICSDSRIYIALSGGMDSCVLLHSLSRFLKQHPQSNLSLCAVHVNHNLQASAIDWQNFCLAQCNGLDIEFKALSVNVGSTKQQGLEAAARKARYSAIYDFIVKDSMAKGCQNAVVVTGHHQRDQAETLLLNLLRGAGANGLAAMPKLMEVDFTTEFDERTKATQKSNLKIKLARPFLQVAYSDIQGYANAENIAFEEDPSNSDQALRRNYLRNTVLPSLEVLWPASEQSLSNAALNMQDALEVMDESAAQLLKQTLHESDFIEFNEVVLTQKVSLQKNLLRYWFKLYWPEFQLSGVHYEWVLDALKNYELSGNKAFSYKLKQAEIKIYKKRCYLVKTLPSNLRGNLPKNFSNSFASVNDLQSFFTDLSTDNNTKPGSELDSKLDKNDILLYMHSDFIGGLGYLHYFNALELQSNVVLMSVSLFEERFFKLKAKPLKAFFQANNIPVWQRAFWPVIWFENLSYAKLLGGDYAFTQSCFELGKLELVEPELSSFESGRLESKGLSQNSDELSSWGFSYKQVQSLWCLQNDKIQ